MTEKEKMIAGELYNSGCEELSQDRINAKKLCHKYNNLEPDNYEERKNILKELFGKTKENFWIEPTFWCDYGYNIEIGENFYSNHNLVILDPRQRLRSVTMFLSLRIAVFILPDIR